MTVMTNFVCPCLHFIVVFVGAGSPSETPDTWLRLRSVLVMAGKNEVRREYQVTLILQILNKDDHCATRRIIFTYPMIAYTDMEDSVKAEVMEIATNACEKFLSDNQAVNI